MAIPKGYESFDVGDEIVWNPCRETKGTVVDKTDNSITFEYVEYGAHERTDWHEDWDSLRHWIIVRRFNPIEVY